MGKDAAEGILDQLAAILESRRESARACARVASRECDPVAAEWHSGAACELTSLIYELKRLRASQEPQ